MKVQANNNTTAAAAAVPAQTQKAAETSPTSANAAGDQAGALRDRLHGDGFEGIVKGGCLPPFGGRPGETLSFGDRKNAADLKETLSSPINQLRVQMGEKDETITRNPDGTYSGPNGEPLAQVKLNDGTTAYVDPNTNKYYLTDEKVNPFTGQVQATGPYDLPADAQFSNSHFSEADVKGIQRHAATGSPFDVKPWPPFEPRPIPFPGLPIEPKPLPFPGRPLDPIMLTGADLKG
jgi:hypothetical protein